MVEKAITNLDLSKASGPDCIPVVVLKNYEPELSYILAKLFNKCLKESCFPDCWKVSPVVSFSTPKMVEKAITNLDLSKASGPDCITVVVLRFPSIFKNAGERSTAKNYRPVSLLSVVSKVFEKLVNNRIVDHLEKFGLFFDIQFGFRSS